MATADRQELTTLKGLTPPPARAARFDAYLKDVEALIAIDRQQQAMATNSDLRAYRTLGGKRSALGVQATKIARGAGLATCAGQGLSAQDVARVARVVSSSATTSEPSACTKLETPAFVKQLYGSVAKCVQAQTHPTSPNPKSATVTHVAGAGDFAYVDAILHFANGRKARYAVAVYRQGGEWRDLALRSH